MYQPGEFNQKIELQREQDAPDGFGGTKRAWKKYGKEWVKVKQLAAKESLEGDRVETQTRYLVVMHFREDILPDDRIVWGKSFLSVVQPLYRGGMQIYLEVECNFGR